MDRILEITFDLDQKMVIFSYLSRRTCISFATRIFRSFFDFISDGILLYGYDYDHLCIMKQKSDSKFHNIFIVLVSVPVFQ